MSDKPHLISTRRCFLSTAGPLCALACLKGGEVLGQDAAKHKFDTPVDKIPTLRESFANQFGPVIGLARTMESQLGNGKTIDILKKGAYDYGYQRGQQQAKDAEQPSLHAYTRQFTDPKAFENTVTMSVVEDGPRAVELRVTECLWASTFLDAKAGDIGYAFICYGDYGWTKGYSEGFELIRDKTLMQGHDHCNHRYVAKG